MASKKPSDRTTSRTCLCVKTRTGVWPLDLATESMWVTVRRATLLGWFGQNPDVRGLNRKWWWGNQRLKIEGSLSKNFVLREEGKLNSGCRGSGVKGFSVYFSHVGGIRASVSYWAAGPAPRALAQHTGPGADAVLILIIVTLNLCIASAVRGMLGHACGLRTHTLHGFGPSLASSSRPAFTMPDEQGAQVEPRLQGVVQNSKGGQGKNVMSLTKLDGCQQHCGSQCTGNTVAFPETRPAQELFTPFLAAVTPVSTSHLSWKWWQWRKGNRAAHSCSFSLSLLISEECGYNVSTRKVNKTSWVHFPLCCEQWNTYAHTQYETQNFNQMAHNLIEGKAWVFPLGAKIVRSLDNHFHFPRRQYYKWIWEGTLHGEGCPWQHINNIWNTRCFTWTSKQLTISSSLFHQLYLSYSIVSCKEFLRQLWQGFQKDPHEERGLFNLPPSKKQQQCFYKNRDKIGQQLQNNHYVLCWVISVSSPTQF